MVEGLMEILESQALINRAVGAIMAGGGRTAEEALERLRHLAMASGSRCGRSRSSFSTDR